MEYALPPGLAAFLLTSLIIELTPGPNMTWLAIVALTDGKWAGYRAVGGVATGLAVIGLLGAIGVTEIIKASQPAYQALRWAGVLFLIYLAWEGWTGGEAGENGTHRHITHFQRGLITNLLNPKAAVFYVTVLPTFVAPGLLIMPQTLTLTAGYVFVATAVHGIIVAAAAFLKPFLVESDREQLVRRLLSALLLLVALWFAWSTAQ